MAARLQVTVWVDPARRPKRAEFAPFAGWAGRWTLLCPEGSRLVSDDHRGILVEGPGGDLATPLDLLTYAEVGGSGYEVRDGWESDDGQPDGSPGGD